MQGKRNLAITFDQQSNFYINRFDIKNGTTVLGVEHLYKFKYSENVIKGDITPKLKEGTEDLYDFGDVFDTFEYIMYKWYIKGRIASIESGFHVVSKFEFINN